MLTCLHDVWSSLCFVCLHPSLAQELPTARTQSVYCDRCAHANDSSFMNTLAFLNPIMNEYVKADTDLFMHYSLVSLRLEVCISLYCVDALLTRRECSWRRCDREEWFVQLAPSLTEIQNTQSLGIQPRWDEQTQNQFFILTRWHCKCTTTPRIINTKYTNHFKWCFH